MTVAILRQEDGEEGAAPWGGCTGANPQGTSVLADELPRDPETETSATVLFCGEKGFEDAFKILTRDAEPGVGYGDADA